jgi:glycosyltransferase involved in cell wall biosynthesis
MNNCLHITHTDPRSDSRILKEIESLAEYSFNIFTVGIEPRENINTKTELQGDISFKTIKLFSRRLIFLPDLARHIISYFELLLKILFMKVADKPSLIHCHDFLMLPLGVLLKTRFNCKLIYDAHELESNKNNTGTFEGKVIFKVEKILWPHIDGLIVVSPSIDDWYKKEIGEKPSSVILNSPKVSTKLVAKTDYLRKYFNIPIDKKIFIYVGGFVRGRGLELISKVFCSSRVSSHLVFLGYGELQGDLHKLSATNSNIHLHPAVPHDEVVSLVKSADFGLCLIENVSLSDFYCLPNKLFEYLFAGVPVLASNFPDIASLLSEVDGGFCCDIDEMRITEAVIKLEEKSISFQMRNLDSYSWENQAGKLIGLYHSVLNNN